ncbi:MAG TPA: HU family DNA-binding protein [Bdellovibrionota bacterium]|nr:HU family DNA-binding protein [Bdellovibrionota bacterium]
MTKQELIEKIATNHKHRSISKAAASDLVESLFDNLSLAIRRGKRFTYPGFGTFAVKKRKERKGRNPQSGEEMMIPASKTVVFRASANLKQDLK